MKRYFIGIFPAAAMAAATLLPGCENENNVTGGKANISVPSQVALDDIAGDGEIRTFDVESDGYWSVIATGMGPEKHTAYAVQWFAMALALFGLYLYLGWHNAREKRHGNGHQSA